MAFSRRSGRAALVLVASAFASAAPLAAQQSHRDVSPTPEVRKLVLNGVSDAIDKDELRANIYTTATSCESALLALICKFSRWRAIEKRQYLDRQELQRDVLRIRVFYYKRGFRETEVDTAVTPLNEKQVAVRFDIREGPPTLVTDVDVVADSTLLPPAEAAAALRSCDAGQPLDLTKLDSMRVGITNELWEQGYADALVDTSSIVDPVARTAQVQFRVVPEPPDARRADRDQRHGRDLADRPCSTR